MHKKMGRKRENIDNRRTKESMETKIGKRKWKKVNGIPK